MYDYNNYFYAYKESGQVQMSVRFKTIKKMTSNIYVNGKFWARGYMYKTFFMLSSIEHNFFPAHKC